MTFYNQENPEIPMQPGEDMPSTETPDTETTENEPSEEGTETTE